MANLFNLPIPVVTGVILVKMSALFEIALPSGVAMFTTIEKNH